MTISLGAVNGGPEISSTPFAIAWRRISGFVRQKRQEVNPNESSELNVVFHVPGSLLTPEHIGLRMDKFSPELRKLVIQVAVPEDAVCSKHPERFIFRSIREAIQLAQPAFKEHNLEFSVKDNLQIMRVVEQAYRE